MYKPTTRKLLSLLLSLTILLSLFPVPVSATGDNQVYISISFDGQFIADRNNNPVAHIPVPLSDLKNIDLTEYGLADYQYDNDGDGEHEITALHLYIYTQETILGDSWSNVTVSGGAGSIFFESGLFGIGDCNLNYYLNGEYPAVDGWGVTADQLVLTAGDFLDIAGYTSWNFFSDSAAGFHYFIDSNGNITHSYNTIAGTELSVKLGRRAPGFSGESGLIDVTDYTLSYGTTFDTATGTVTTDSSGEARISFPSAGTWYLWCEGGYGAENPSDIVSSPAWAEVTVTAPAAETPEYDADDVLDAAMAQLAATVTAPSFGTDAGEWTVLSLARGGYFAKDNAYFTDYYNRIVETVNTKAASVNMNGALHRSKSTDNSRLIVALASIGKDATAVGDWDLTAPYEDFDWIKNQGVNGAIWALIALDSHDYQTTDTAIRQQCVDYILDKQLSDGGWALAGTAADPDVTGMALQALYNYKNQPAVAAASQDAFACLTEIQNENGTYTSGGEETCESCAQVIVACATWGIDPDTDSRFIKNGNSVVDGFLHFYLPDEAAFSHVANNQVNGMATDQACYSLAAYNRLQNGKPALYNMSDVIFDASSTGGETGGSGESDPDTMTASIGLPASIAGDAGATFNAVISVNKWDNEAGYKLLDFIVSVPSTLSVTGVTVGSQLSGGAVSYHLEEATGKLRIVYFDANENSDLSVSGTQFPAELFTIGFSLKRDSYNASLPLAITGMSLKKSSNSTNAADMLVVDTSAASGTVKTNKEDELVCSSVCLYEGDGVDLIPTNKKAIAVTISGATVSNLVFNDGTHSYVFCYSPEITQKVGVSSFVALVDASVETKAFAKIDNYATKTTSPSIRFGDANADGLINAQDALAAVDCWLRKTDAPTDNQILVLNVNGDSRINTFDALGIVETFVNNGTFAVVTKAAILGTAT